MALSTATETDPAAEAAARRCEEFIAANVPGGKVPGDWSKRMARAGYVAPHWPAPYGLDAGPAEQLAIDSVLRAARLPKPLNPIGIGWAGPTLLVAGTAEQQARWLPGILDGSELWCQLFSEPDAGSDLASLRTTAIRDGDEYVVTGGKVWTTLAHVAALRHPARAHRPDRRGAPRHHLFRARHAFAGNHGEPDRADDRHARVQRGRARRRAGARGERRRHRARRLAAREGDARERAGVALGRGRALGRGPTTGDLLDLVRARRRCRRPGVATATRRVAHRVGDPAPHPAAHGFGTAARARTRPGNVGAQGARRRARPARHGVGTRALGTDGLLADFAPYGDRATGWAYGFLYSPTLTIGGGTSEVQRTVIGEKILGLPK